MKPLTSKQKNGIWLGIAIAVAMGVFPPWVEGGMGGVPGSYAPIFEPPQSRSDHAPMQIDLTRLLLQWAMVGMVVSGLISTNAEAGEPSGQSQTKKNGFPPKAAPSSSSGSSGAVVATQEAVVLEAEPARTLKFNDAFSIGAILIDSADDPDYWEWVADARGTVDVPAAGRLQLELLKDSKVDLGALGRSEMSAIASIDASDSPTDDDAVACIAALKDLQELDLSNTKVTVGCITHLVRLKNLEKLWLDGTELSDANTLAIAALSELPKLKKVSFENTSLSDSSVITLKDAAKNCQFVLSNGKNA